MRVARVDVRAIRQGIADANCKFWALVGQNRGNTTMANDQALATASKPRRAGLPVVG